MVALTTGLRWLADPVLGNLAHFLPFVPVVLIATYGGGLGPGLTSIALSAIAGVYLFVRDPVLSPQGRSDLWNVILFVAEAGIIAFLTAALRRARDEARASASRAETAARQREQFVMRVSHEWRAPLNALAGWVSQLRNRPDDVAFVRRAAASMAQAVETQTRLVEDLLDFSRGSRGKLSFQPVRLLIAIPLNVALDAIRDEAAKKAIDLRMELQAPGLRVWGDQQRLEQILTNLLSNAVKFTSSGGRITLRVLPAGDKVKIQVIDTGVGIDPRALPRLFEPFEQGDPDRDAALGGLGLGLAITRDLVLLHGGTVEASSEGPGRASVFTVRLPISAAVSSETAGVLSRR